MKLGEQSSGTMAWNVRSIDWALALHSPRRFPPPSALSGASALPLSLEPGHAWALFLSWLFLPMQREARLETGLRGELFAHDIRMGIDELAGISLAMPSGSSLWGRESSGSKWPNRL